MRWRREHRRPAAAGRSGISDTPSPRRGGVLPPGPSPPINGLGAPQQLVGRRRSVPLGPPIAVLPVRAAPSPLPRRPPVSQHFNGAVGLSVPAAPELVRAVAQSRGGRGRTLCPRSARVPAGCAAGSAPRSIPALHCGETPPAALQRERSRPAARPGQGVFPGADEAPCPPCSSARPRCYGPRRAARSSCSRRAGAERLAVAGFGRVMALDRLTSHPALLLLCFVRSMRFSGFPNTQAMSASRNSPLAHTSVCTTVLSLLQ